MWKKTWIITLGALVLTLALTSVAHAEGGTIAFGGGGPMFGLFLPELGEVNGFLIDNGYAPFAGPLIAAGGSGRGGVIGDLAFGGLGWGASIKSENETMEACLSIGFGGFDLGYAVGGDSRSVLTIGAVLGGGGSSLEMVERSPESSPEWTPAGIIVELAKLEFNTAFVAIEPYVDMQVQLLDWLGFNVRIGYLFAPIGFSWTDVDTTLGAPDLNPSGPFVGFSVTFGGIGREEPKDLPTRLQDVVDDAVGHRGAIFPGALLYVTAPELGVWSGAAGVADVETEEAMRSNSKFGIGSITKTFVSVVVLQLVEEGVLLLDDTLPKVLPEETAARFPDSDRITVRMLLNHTSGIAEWVSRTTHEATAADPSTIWDIETVLDLAAAQAPYFPPGEGWTYSNTDYTLLGMIIEQATGQSWREEVRSRILEPLDMDDTVVRDPGDTSMPEGHAHGYADLGGGAVDITYADPAMAGAAGGNAMVSTTTDLAQFLDALLAGKLFASEETLGEMLDWVDAPDEHEFPYWCGLGLERYIFPEGITVIGHGGGAVGYGSVMYQAPDYSITIVGSGNFFNLEPAYVDLLMSALEELMK